MRKKKTKHFWDKLASEEVKKDFAKRSWGGINKVALNHNYLVTGDRNYYWIDYMRDKYFKEGYAGHVLSLGCGEGFGDQADNGRNKKTFCRNHDRS